jgi:hypothetical protein
LRRQIRAEAATSTQKTGLPIARRRFNTPPAPGGPEGLIARTMDDLRNVEMHQMPSAFDDATVNMTVNISRRR